MLNLGSLAEISSHKINPSGCINRYGSSPLIKPKASWLANVFENIMWLICHDMTRSSRDYDRRLMILTKQKFLKVKVFRFIEQEVLNCCYDQAAVEPIFDKH